MVTLTGNTKAVWMKLKQMGAKWDGEKVTICEDKAAAAQAIIDADEERRNAYKTEIANAKLIPGEGKGKRIVYSRGYPYGCPILYLRGGGTQICKRWLQQQKFMFENYAWVLYGAGSEEIIPILTQLREAGYTIVPKSDQAEKGYVIDGFEG